MQLIESKLMHAYIYNEYFCKIWGSPNCALFSISIEASRWKKTPKHNAYHIGLNFG